MKKSAPTPAEAVFLTKSVVIEIHAEQVAEHGGLAGLRDEGLLDSALAQPLQAFGGKYLHHDVFHMAAAYLFHIAGNHPFVDGNKRTALAACLVFLELNGYRIQEKATELADLVLEMISQHKDKAWTTNALRTRAVRIRNSRPKTPPTKSGWN